MSQPVSTELPRVAICLYGHIRAWEKCKKSFLQNMCYFDPKWKSRTNPDYKNPPNDIVKLNPDIFIHIYSETDWKKQQSTKYSPDKIKSLFAELNPTEIVVEECTDDWKKQRRGESEKYKHLAGMETSEDFVYNMYCYFRKVNLCHQMMKNYAQRKKISYDIVVSTRPYIMYNHKIDLSAVLRDPSNHQKARVSPAPDPTDEWVAGTMSMMDIFAER